MEGLSWCWRRKTAISCRRGAAAVLRAGLALRSRIVLGCAEGLDNKSVAVALADGFRESSESWADLLRDGKRRGMAPRVLAVGTARSASGRPSVTCSPKPGTAVLVAHKIGNVLNALPKSAQPAAKRALAEIYNAEDKTHAQTAAKLFAAEFGVKWPKAAATITDDLDVLLAFYDYPAEHWVTYGPPTRSSRPSPPFD